MKRRWVVLALLGGLACGGPPPQSVSPQSLTEALAQFLSAVKANDLDRMGTLWGTERGPAAGRMKAEELRQRLSIIQRYLAHSGYRVIEGPLVVAGRDDERSFRVELQRDQCNFVLPIDLVRAKNGAWLVYDVHLESAGNPASACRPVAPGTRP